MTFRDTFFNVKQLMVNRLIDFGLEDADIDLGWTTLLTLAQNTRITIDVPLNLTYSDDFSITGTLETATYRRLSNKTLKLKVGNTVVATTETDINGAYSFTTSPVSMGNHSFQVIFEGTNIHNPSQSSVINRTIGKETSVINLDIIPTAHINGSTAVAGTLKSDDAELIKNATMKLDTTSGNTLTTTTNDYGQFSFTLTDIPSFNNVSVTCYFEGDEYYSPSTITTPVAVYQETLELTSDKNILSYADNDYATLTVQYKDTGDMNLGAGKEIDLYRVYEVSGIQLTSDKDILSYADNDTCTITAQLINGVLTPENVKVSDVPVTFKAPSDVYDDKESIPTQTSAFSMLFKKESGDNIIIHSPSESDEDYLFLDISNISTDSELRLDWDTNNVNFYIDGVLSNTHRIYNQYTGDDNTVWNYSDLAISGYGVISDIQIDNFHTINTDNTGKATFTYYSKGIGDIEITASISDTDGTKLIQTYSIHDDLFYDSMINSVKNAWSITSGTTISSDSTGTLFSYNNDTRYIKLPVSETSFVMEWDFITGTGNDGFGVETWNGTTWTAYGNYHDGKYNLTGTSGAGITSSFLTNVHCKYIVNGNSHSLYVNNQLVNTVTPKSASGTFYIGFYLSSAITSQKLKNVEIKPL